MPGDGPSVIPGKEGTDYHFVRYGDKIYVVYRVKLPNGKFVNTTWRVEKDDYEALGIKPESVKKIGRSAFKSLNVFGSSNEIARTGSEEHPFNQYIKDLKERYGNVSWFSNREFMSVMLMGWAENWSAAELEQRLKRTKWYNTRTDAERQWELELTKAERQSSRQLWETRVTDALDDLYGPNVDWRADIKPSELKKFAERIASGKLGDPQEGIEIWLSNQRKKAEKIEGTQAWIERQRAEEEQRAFMNRPEDMREKLRAEAQEWLGPRGMPDNATLRKWSEEMVAEIKSDGDWQKFLRTQAQSLYPWLGPDERWQDRAGIYKRIMEDAWGQPVDWGNKYLYELGERNANGALTGKALGFDDFEKLVRSDNRFWGGPTARQEGFELFNFLNATFQGVGA
jgi:hypothetical protein